MHCCEPQILSKLPMGMDDELNVMLEAKGLCLASKLRIDIGFQTLGPQDELSWLVLKISYALNLFCETVSTAGSVCDGNELKYV